MLNIQELTARENELLSQVHGRVGSMNEKTQQLIESGIFDSYGELHNEYAVLAKTGNLEALKRAFFIQWYAVTEPSCFTGIPSRNPWGDGKGLDKSTEKTVFDLVAQMIDSDEELKWMTAWYSQITDYYLEAFWGKSAIIEDLRSYIHEIGSSMSKPGFIIEPLEERGQMGEYFVSIFKAKESRTK
jgi:hypothetical protein